MTMTFSKGQTEAMGVIERVSYKVEGNDVLVTYLNGISKGMTIRYTLTSKDTASSGLGPLRRIR